MKWRVDNDISFVFCIVVQRLRRWCDSFIYRGFHPRLLLLKPVGACWGCPPGETSFPPAPVSPQVEKGGDVECIRVFVRVLWVDNVVFNTFGVGGFPGRCFPGWEIEPLQGLVMFLSL